MAREGRGGSECLSRVWGVCLWFARREAVGRLLVPLYTRSLDSEGQPHVQETCLQRLQVRGKSARLAPLLTTTSPSAPVLSMAAHTSNSVPLCGARQCSVPRQTSRRAHG